MTRSTRARTPVSRKPRHWTDDEFLEPDLRLFQGDLYMKHLWTFLLALLLLRGGPLHAQVAAVEDDFEGFDDPCITGDWDCKGSVRWISRDADPCADPNTADICNLYDPGEGYMRITPG